MSPTSLLKRATNGKTSSSSRRGSCEAKIHSVRALLVLTLFAMTALVLGQGGPPLLTDDPGTVDEGRWELNLSWINRQLPGRVENELPHIDLSRGVSPNAHMKIEVPWVIATED